MEGGRRAVCGQGVGSALGTLGAGRPQARTSGAVVGGVAHLTTFLRLALSVSPSLSWFEFFPPLHPLHDIFPSASAIRHPVMVMVIGGGQGGRGRPGYRLPGRHFWIQSNERGVPGVYLVQGGVWGGGLPGSLWPSLSSLGVSSLLGVQGPFSPLGASQALPEKSSGVFGSFAPSGPRTAAPGHPSLGILPGSPASSPS